MTMGSNKSDPLQSGARATTNASGPAVPKPGYGKIVLTLKNQLLPDDKLAPTPSQTDGLDAETETDLRIYGCELIQTAGILLKLPQVAMATGQVLLQRFYYSKSLVRQPVEHTAMACVCLASKIEEAPRRARDVINVFSHIRQVNSNKGSERPISPVIVDHNYIQLKNQVIKAERRVLKELGFCVHIKHPHKIIVMYLQVLCLEQNPDLMQYSWNYMNDSLRTDVFVRYQPETVACACIYLTARKLKLPLPKNPAWYSIFGVSERDIRDVCVRILRLYNRPKPNVDELEKKVDELCKKYHDAKIKAKGNSGNNTPNNNSPSSPSTQKTTGAHNAWGGFISRSGSHIVPVISEKRSRSRTRSPSHSPAVKHHKRSKKHGGRKTSRSRSPAPPPSRKKSHKRRSYSPRSRSNSPHKVSRKSRDKRKSRSPSNDRENRNDRYIDRYEKVERYEKYKDERDRYEKEGRYEEKERKEKKYERDEKDRYRRGKHREEEKERDRSKDDRGKDRRR